jgi:hypothetical protein
MAGAIIIACGIGILLLILAGYVIIGGTLASADITAAAQKDMTLQQEERLGTSISIADYTYEYWCGSQQPPDQWSIYFRVLNNGNQIIHNPSNVQFMLFRGSNPPLLYNYGSGTYGTMTWYYDGNFDTTIRGAGEIINPGQWDPGEYLFGQIKVPMPEPTNTDKMQVVLANGVNAMTTSNIYWYDDSIRC